MCPEPCAFPCVRLYVAPKTSRFSHHSTFPSLSVLDYVCHQHSPNKLAPCALNAVLFSFLSRLKGRRVLSWVSGPGAGESWGRVCWSYLCLTEMLAPFTDATKATPWGIRKAINPCGTKAGYPCSSPHQAEFSPSPSSSSNSALTLPSTAGLLCGWP